MKKSKLFIGIIFFAIILTAFLFVRNFEDHSYALSDKVDRILSAMQKDIDSPQSIKGHKYPYESSNPYDYVKNNKYYDELVALGPDALPVLENKVNNSENNGLGEYMMAIAAENIAKVNLKNDNDGRFVYGWSNAKGWAEQWGKHLKLVPEEVKNITSSWKMSKKEKVEKLSRLGTPAIPFILDEVANGNTEISGSLDYLLKDDKKVEDFNSTKIEDIERWSKNNKNKFEDLRQLVEDHQ